MYSLTSQTRTLLASCFLSGTTLKKPWVCGIPDLKWFDTWLQSVVLVI